jgi:hypothetical protein
VNLWIFPQRFEPLQNSHQFQTGIFLRFFLKVVPFEVFYHQPKFGNFSITGSATFGFSNLGVVKYWKKDL